MKKYLPLASLIAFSISFMLIFYGKPLLHPDEYFFNDSGDGIKNYFTYAFYIKHNSSWMNFEGMNFPFGEHILYTDCHPALAFILKTLSSGSSFFSSHSIGILNFIMMLSVFLTFFVSYLLLKEFGVKKWMRLLFSVGMTLLAPQIFRLGGHYALSYSPAIPLSWLLLIKCLRDPGRMIYPILLCLDILLWLFIHAYLGVIVVAFLAVMLFIHFFADKEKRKKTAGYLKTFSALIVPVAAFYLFAVFTDMHSGRTSNPSGFFLYNAEPDDIFLPHHPPIRQWLELLTGTDIIQEWEAWSYVGFATTLIFLSMIIILIITIFKKKSGGYYALFFDDRILNISLFSAFVVLLFAMAIPFRQNPALLDIFPFVKPFRATGRFAWPFFFASQVFAATFAQKIYERNTLRGKRAIGISIILVIGIMNIIEGMYYHFDISKAITGSKNLFHREFLADNCLSSIESINPSDYQAIIALPFFYQGSETFSRPRQEETVRASLILSYHTGIPLVNADLTRTSIAESKKIVQLVSPAFYKKEIEADLPDKRPFLVIRTGDPLTGNEQDVLKRCAPLRMDENIVLYSASKEDLFRNTSQEALDSYRSAKQGLFSNGRFELSRDSAFLYFTSFDETPSEKPFRGTGGYSSTKTGRNILAEFSPGTFSAGKEYRLGIWMYNGMKDALNDWFRLIVEEYDAEKGVFHTTTCFPEQAEVINGDWSLVECSFRVTDPKNRIYIVTKGKKESKGPFFADDLLIRESGTDVYNLDDIGKRLFYNNHEIIIP